MKIAFVGGGTGGHFYPIIAVVEAVEDIVDERNLVKPELYFIGNDPMDEKLLFEHNLEYLHSPAGKVRRYFSFKNIPDAFRTLIGIIRSIFLMFRIYPDVVFSKGGYVSFPVVTAAWLLRIPVFIHDSDAVPGRANLWAARFAKRIAISYPEAIDYFTRKDVVAYTGNPVRKEVSHLAIEGATEYLGLEAGIPTILILGGSQGAVAINDAVVLNIPQYIEHYQIIHQTGEVNIRDIEETVHVTLANNPNKSRYKPFAFLNELAYRMSAGIASIIVARAGSGTIFEIATWEKPAILIPIPEQISRDQRKNAYAYARDGAAVVLEQENLTPHLLISEIDRLLQDPQKLKEMSEAAKTFKRPDAARLIAEELIAMCLEHEK